MSLINRCYFLYLSRFPHSLWHCVDLTHVTWSVSMTAPCDSMWKVNHTDSTSSNWNFYTISEPSVNNPEKPLHSYTFREHTCQWCNSLSMVCCFVFVFFKSQRHRKHNFIIPCFMFSKILHIRAVTPARHWCICSFRQLYKIYLL